MPAQGGGERVGVDAQRGGEAVVAVGGELAGRDDGACVRSAEGAVQVEADLVAIALDHIRLREAALDALARLADRKAPRPDGEGLAGARSVLGVEAARRGLRAQQIEHALGARGEQLAHQRRLDPPAGDARSERAGAVRGRAAGFSAGISRGIANRLAREVVRERTGDAEDAILLARGSVDPLDEPVLEALGAQPRLRHRDAPGDALRPHAVAVERELDSPRRERTAGDGAARPHLAADASVDGAARRIPREAACRLLGVLRQVALEGAADRHSAEFERDVAVGPLEVGVSRGGDGAVPVASLAPRDGHPLGGELELGVAVAQRELGRPRQAEFCELRPPRLAR